MNQSLAFIYDGECPFCNHFAELVELQSGIPSISIVNGRENPSLIEDLYQKGYDLDRGAILIKDKEILHGAQAVNWICSSMGTPSDSLFKVLKAVFQSKKRSHFFFPLLIWARRTSLFLKGVPSKLIPNS